MPGSRGMRSGSSRRRPAGCVLTCTPQSATRLMSSGFSFRPFLSLRRRLQESGGRLVFCNLTPAVSEVFQVVRLISADGSSPAPFDVKPDVSAALAFLQAPLSAD